MGDVMLFGVLGMPEKLAMNDELSRHQFYSRAQECVRRLRKAEDTNRELTERLEAAESVCRAVREWFNDRGGLRAVGEMLNRYESAAPVKPTDDETIRGRCPVAGEERRT